LLVLLATYLLYKAVARVFEGGARGCSSASR
jgi:hypothetical protein